jgi:hypothetical protein
MNDFLWLVDGMIAQRSSKAYLMREDVIAYKSVGG